VACRLLRSVGMKNFSCLCLLALLAACSSSGGKSTDAAPPDVAVDATPDQAADKAADRAADQGGDPDVLLPDVAGDRTPGDTTGDTASDGGSACAACAADELCVADFDGTCHALGTHCVKTTAACPAATCSAACDQYACRHNDAGVIDYTCMTAACPGAPTGAILCHGP
jgi:hypothetical protein